MTFESSRQIDRTRLAPEDAFSTRSLSTKSLASDAGLQRLGSRRTRDRRRNRSRSRRPGKNITSYKKLLWVKHPFPDNYTDESTFLDHLQRNPRLQLYEFWPLVAESMVIVQQVCAVIVFVCCFSGIIQERVSSITVVGCGTVCTVLGWVLWDRWVGRDAGGAGEEGAFGCGREEPSPLLLQEDIFASNGEEKAPSDAGKGLGLDIRIEDDQHSLPGALLKPQHTTRPSSSSSSSSSTRLYNRSPLIPPISHPSDPQQAQLPSSIAPPLRTHTLLSTLKSALLIHTTLLALSPLLKSLTKSTASDSIWAISIILMALNIFFFDYTSYTPSSQSSSDRRDSTVGNTGGGLSTTTSISAPAGTASSLGSANFPASLSTNAGLMASTVLASRLSDTLAVFSLTLFSIEVFGLFPVFRRVLRQRWWRGHMALTLLLVAGAGGGVAGVTSNGVSGDWAVGRWIGGVLAGGICALGSMGVAAWWLIGLQRYKDEMSGPWDVARPVLRRRWD